MIEFHCSFAKHEKKMLREKLPLSTKVEAIAINHSTSNVNIYYL